MAEKIYLQTDSRVYANDETIWFKAIVTNAADLTPTRLSAVLYTELIDANKNIIERKLIHIDNGIAEGFFQTDQSYNEGVYLIRAYTTWNMNFGAAFFANQYISIVSTDPTAKPNPFRYITVTTEPDGEQRLKALLDPFAIDSMHSNHLTLLLTQAEKTDTLIIKKDADGAYPVNQPLHQHGRYLSLTMQTKNNYRFTKTILLTNGYTNLQFFPESGQMIHGIPALLGLKFTDSMGKGIAVSGEIINSRAELIANFNCNQLGIGTVMLPQPDSNEKYFARITGSKINTGEKSFPLPRVNSKGNMLSVMRDDDKIQVKAFSNYLDDDSILVRITSRGLLYFDIKGKLHNGRLSFSLNAASLPEGIVALSMMTTADSALAQRLYFNQRPESRLQLSVSTDRAMYSAREQTKLTININDKAGRPVDANVSVQVSTIGLPAKLLQSNTDISSALLLTTEFNSKIEAPEFYFANDSVKLNDLDALLLTQEWQQYNYTNTTGNIIFNPETELKVTGQVTGRLFTNKPAKDAGLMMMTFGQKQAIQTAVSDSLGRFNFSVNNEYTHNLNVLIQGTNRSGKKKDYTITIDKKTFPPVVFNQQEAAQQPDSIVQLFVKKSMERKTTMDNYAASAGGKILKEVVLKRSAFIPERKMMTDKYGSPSVVIEGKVIKEKEASWSYGLYSVLLFNFPDKIRMERMENGSLYARLHNGLMTLVVIDGIPVAAEDYPFIPNIPPEEVKSVELIEYAKDFTNLFCDVFPRSCGIGSPDAGNVIAIYTNGRKGLFGANKVTGITKAVVPVYTAPREFDAPQWDMTDTATLKKPDLRTLIHWAPSLKTDSTGNVTVSFYNSDIPGTIEVIVEAMASNGAIGYKRLTYTVKQK